MIGYIQTIRDREYKVCTPQIFDQLTNSQPVQLLTQQYRGGVPEAKQQLPAFLFQGYDPNALLGKKGSRLARNLLPTGLFLMDFDHVEDPCSVYDKFLSLLPMMGYRLEEDVALAHITPSGKGLRLVIRISEGQNIEQSQRWVASYMNLQADTVVKDLSRLSFCPMAEDILFINETLLFQPPQQITHVPTTTMHQPAADAQPGQAPRDNGAATTARPGTHQFPQSYTAEGVSIPYQRIVEELTILYGGIPDIGNRNNVLFRLVSDLSHITDHSEPWLRQIVPTFGLPQEEVDAIIHQHAAKSHGRGWSKKLSEAVSRCRREQEFLSDQTASLTDAEKVAKGLLPPPLPADLPPLVELLTRNVMPFQRAATAMAVFPALGAHVSNASFQLLDGSDTELSLMCVLLGEQSVGKSCINRPLQYIMDDIEQQDEVNRNRERIWQQEQLNKKPNEKGKSKPEDIIVRYIGTDTTPAAFIGRLFMAERGGKDAPADFPRHCCYSQCAEIEDLYNFCSSATRSQITQIIRHSYDRDVLSSERWTANAANFRTVLRWNWVASSTIEGGRKFFGRSLSDGTTGRVDFCVLLAPEDGQVFRYGTYDDAYAQELLPYMQRLTEYRGQLSASGRPVPTLVPQVMELEEELNAMIHERILDEATPTCRNYAWRAKVNAIKKALILWIANGQKWDSRIWDFTVWAYQYAMWCKLSLFGDKADEAFQEGVFRGREKGKSSPLKKMKQRFTYGDFVQACTAMGFKSSPMQMLYLYKSRGILVQEGETFTIRRDYCQRYGIPLTE